MRGLSFIADGEFFTADVNLVQKVARNLTVTPVLTAPESVVGIANIKGRVVTILSLAALLARNTGQDKQEKIEKIEKKVHTVNAIIFKPFTDGDDQMGLLIEKPGDLIDISDDKIMPLSVKPSAGNGAEAQFCLSGMTEVGGELYRIVNIDSIINRFKYGGEYHADKTILTGGFDYES